MNFPELKAVIFDMDGVLVDSEPLHLIAFQEFFKRFEIAYSAEDNREFLGRKDIAIAEILIDRHKLGMTPAALVEAKEEILSRLLLEDAQPRPGVHSTLATLTGLSVPMAVASSATMPTIDLVTHTLNIRKHFANLTSGDEVVHGKPAPDVYLLAAKRLGVAPEKCLVVEDTIAGIRAAKSAGMYCVSIPCEATAHQDHSFADLRLTSLEELPVAEIFKV
ncbi:MAG: HAD family phosphatase [Candidatus Obscuribacterales bacterium]|jgi:HAD superfamily hydrolase (TIGR01509 family)|nr:HAD family phosphatase [Candidatus Obscuribacterales bacterium]